MKIKWLCGIILPLLLFLGGCKKNGVNEKVTPFIPPVIPDLVTPVNCVVYGFVTDENGNAMPGATVQGGTSTYVTSDYGYFRLNSTSFPKSAGLIKVTKPGYFIGYKTIIPDEGASLFIRVQMVTRTVNGSFDAVTGGSVSTSNGGIVNIPANGVVTAAGSGLYNGLVNVSIHWYDPSNTDATSLTMPGDLRGIDTEGSLQGLTTFGMLNVELYGSSGELLQMSPGKKALLHFPLPDALVASAPPHIPLWYFDEATGLWKEDGNAIKTNGSYEGEVSHFTPWNCDMPWPPSRFTCRLMDQALNPLPNLMVTVTASGSPNATTYFYSDSAGYVEGILPMNNAAMQMKVLTPCNGAVPVSTFSTATSAIELGVIMISTSEASLATFTGAVNDCNSSPVTDGYVLIAGGGYNQVINISNGTFEHTSVICPSAGATMIAVDNNAGQQSNPQPITLSEGVNDLGIVSVCNIPAGESITYSIDGGAPVTITMPFYSFNADFDFVNDTTVIRSADQVNSTLVFDLGFEGPAVSGSHAPGNTIRLGSSLYSFALPAAVNISVYGLIGEFIIGTINTNILDAGMNTHTFTCTFQVQRDN